MTYTKREANKPIIQIIDKKPFEYILSIIVGKWKMKMIYLLIGGEVAC